MYGPIVARSSQDDRPGLGDHSADDLGHVDRDVKDHAVREQRVELDELLLLGGVVSLDPSAPNASQSENWLWDSTLFVAASISARNSGSEISRSSVIVQIARPSSRNAL